MVQLALLILAQAFFLVLFFVFNARPDEEGQATFPLESLSDLPQLSVSRKFKSIAQQNTPSFKVSATLKIAIFPYLKFQRFQIDMPESFLLKKKKWEENIISVQRYRG